MSRHIQVPDGSELICQVVEFEFRISNFELLLLLTYQIKCKLLDIGKRILHTQRALHRWALKSVDRETPGQDCNEVTYE